MYPEQVSADSTPEELFDMIDFNGDGTIDIDEFMWACSREEDMMKGENV